MKVQEPVPGGICVSIQGHDRGSWYVITAVRTADEAKGPATVMVADGRLKSISSPKAKNIKHIKLLPLAADEIAAKLAAGRKVYDHEIARAIKLARDTQNK